MLREHSRSGLHVGAGRATARDDIQKRPARNPADSMSAHHAAGLDTPPDTTSDMMLALSEVSGVTRERGTTTRHPSHV